MTENEMRLTASEYYVMSFIRQNSKLGSKAIANWLNMSNKTISNNMRSLEEKGVLVRNSKIHGKDYYNLITSESFWDLDNEQTTNTLH